MKAFFKTKKDPEVEYGTAFMRNGGLVLEKLIALRNGKCNPIRGFSAEELKSATNNYEGRQVLLEAGFFKLYNGFLQDRPILVKKYHDFPGYHSEAINEIAFASHMSVHKNVLKLLGCCLETEIPILVFEYVNNGTLDDHLCSPNNANFEPLLWKQRLKIAVDIANVVAYLHTAFPRPIIHRNIKPTNILLDEDCVAKLTDFSLSISIPDGKTHIEDNLAGTAWHLAPEYILTSRFNEKHDVYSFGVSLLVLLIGKNPADYFISRADYEAGLTFHDNVKKHIEDNRFNEMVDPIIVGEGPWPGKDEELQSFATLVLRCIHETQDNRPAIIDVGKELRHIYRSGISPV